MAKLNVPSLQHLARNWRPDPKRVCWQLVELAKNPPIFNYNPLFSAVRDLVILQQPYDQVAEGIRRGVRRDDVRENYLEVLPLIYQHFADVSPDYSQIVERQYYPVSKGLMIPFEPPVLYGLGGQIYFPWFSFWRSNPLKAERLSLFVSIVEEVLLQEPDLEDAKFNILDFSSPGKGQKRELTVIDTRDVERLPNSVKRDMLEIFAEGYFMAQTELASTSANARPEKQDDVGDDDHPRLF